MNSVSDLAVRGTRILLNYPLNDVQLVDDSGELKVLTNGVERLAIGTTVNIAADDFVLTSDLSVSGVVSILGVSNGLILPMFTDAEIVGTTLPVAGRCIIDSDAWQIRVGNGTTYVSPV